MFNRKGVFLTFMVFLLIGAALALNLVLRQSSVREERTMIDESAFREVNETFNSIYSQILEEREGRAGELQQRILIIGTAPSGGDSFSVTQSVPPKTTVSANDIVDALNLFALFLSNEDISQDLNIRAYVPDAFNATAWGAGTEDPDVGFLIQPYCIRYLPLQVEDRLMGLEIPADWASYLDATPECEADDGICHEWGCVYQFNITNVKEIDVNFFVGKKNVDGCIEYPQNEPSCDSQGSFWAGGGDCTTDYSQEPCSIAYCPKVDLNFTETDTANCYFGNPPPNNTPPKCTRGVMGNLDYTKKDNSILLKTNAAGSGITLNLLDSPTGPSPPRVYLLYYDGHEICLDNNILVNIKFTGPVWVDLAGFEFAVGKPGFDLCRRTKWGTCPGQVAAQCVPPATRSCSLTLGVCAGVMDNCIGGVWSGCDYGANYELTESKCSDAYDNDCDELTNCDDSDCSATPVCTCPNGICNTGENCPADAGACTTEPPICRLKSCTNGCNNPATLVSSGQEDTQGAVLCNSTTGCGSGRTPCACNGSGTCCSKKCDNPAYCAGSACYGIDPNCTQSGGNTRACCGNGVCEAGETMYNCPTDNCGGYY